MNKKIKNFTIDKILTKNPKIPKLPPGARNAQKSCFSDTPQKLPYNIKCFFRVVGGGGVHFRGVGAGPPGWGGGYGYTPVWGYPESVIVRPPQTPKSMVRGGILGGVDFKGFGTPSGGGGGGGWGPPPPPPPPPPPEGGPPPGGAKNAKKTRF